MTAKCALGLLTAGLLTACSTTPVPDDAPRPPPMTSTRGECGATRVQEHIGEAYSATRERTIATQSDAGRVRVIRPGQAYTMDYRPDRLNIHVDAAGRISELSCG